MAVAEQEVAKISKNEGKKPLKRMKSGKAADPDNNSVKVWKCCGEFLAGLLKKILGE